LWNSVMLLKSLVVSVAAALLGPALGIAAFYLANSGYPDQPVSTSIRTFAPSAVWYDPSVPKHRLDTAAADLPPDVGGWKTVVNCPDGQALSADGRCHSSSTRPPT
jgi:hypothetical protein